MSLKELMPAHWRELMAAEFESSYFQKLELFLATEWQEQTIYPPKENIFAAFRETPYEKVKVLLLGQDPYHGAGQAHGLSFSVLPGVTAPPSLKNIYKEMKTDVGTTIPNNGYLMPWAHQGVMLLNAVLTVRSGEPTSHKNRGWEKFTDAVIRKLNEKDPGIVFILWGGYAKKKKDLIDEAKHGVIEGIHPSPLSANTGFFGSRPFSQVNEALKKLGHEPIDWQIPNI
jgi:uracil-DNA glycosylase